MTAFLALLLLSAPDPARRYAIVDVAALTPTAVAQAHGAAPSSLRLSLDGRKAIVDITPADEALWKARGAAIVTHAAALTACAGQDWTPPPESERGLLDRIAAWLGLGARETPDPEPLAAVLKAPEWRASKYATDPLVVSAAKVEAEVVPTKEPIEEVKEP